MPPKHGLGRGLDALIPSGPGGEPASLNGVSQIAVGAIGRNPRQPRARLEPTELEELANSIREHGVIQPLIVAQSAYPGQFTLIAGERRLEASRLAGLATVPAIVREATEQQLLEVALVENIQRSDLGPLETALAYKHLADDFGLSHEAIAAKVGKKRVTVTNTLRLLRLPQKLLEALSGGEISEGHARALLQLATAEAQLAAYSTVVHKGLSVRQTEELVNLLQGEKPRRPGRKPKNPETEALAGRLRERLGTKVTLRRGRGRGGALTGTIILHFYSDEELNSIAEAILRE